MTVCSPSILPAPSRREQRRAEIRARIISACLRTFDEKGYATCTVEDLLRAASVSRATFYQHFSGKSDIAQAIVADMWFNTSEMYAAFAVLPELDKPTIRAWLKQVFVRWTNYSAAMGTILRELLTEVASGFGERHQELVAALLGDGRHWRSYPVDEARRRAALLIFQLERAMQEVHLHSWAEDPEALIDTLTEIWAMTLGIPSRSVDHDPV